MKIKINKKLAKDLLDNLNEDFKNKNSYFIEELNSIVSPLSNKKIKINTNRQKQSKGHEKFITFYKKLYPNNNIKENSTIKIEVRGRSKSLEFDIVDFTLKRIIEIQGIQHYQVVGHFHKNPLDLIKQQERDDLKVEWANDNNWRIIHISDKEAKNIKNENDLLSILEDQSYYQE